MLGISIGHAYKIIRSLNDELKKDGYIVIAGKVPKDYFLGNITDFSQKEYFLHLLNYLKNKSKSGADLSDVISAVEEIL